MSVSKTELPKFTPLTDAWNKGADDLKTLIASIPQFIILRPLKTFLQTNNYSQIISQIAPLCSTNIIVHDFMVNRAQKLVALPQNEPINLRQSLVMRKQLGDQEIKILFLLKLERVICPRFLLIFPGYEWWTFELIYIGCGASAEILQSVAEDMTKAKTSPLLTDENESQ